MSFVWTFASFSKAPQQWRYPPVNSRPSPSLCKHNQLTWNKTCWSPDKSDKKPNGGSHIAMYMNRGLGTILSSQFKFDGNCVLLSPQSDRNKILCMAWQLCCRGMYKILLRSDSLLLNYSKGNFSIEFELRAKFFSETGPWCQWYQRFPSPLNSYLMKILFCPP